ncbi:MAG: hypothetical protein IJM30_08815 [Thermoguttaceae bacterium]|nr:hypothetical protein [Thermoguttaceae bacterium]
MKFPTVGSALAVAILVNGALALGFEGRALVSKTARTDSSASSEEGQTPEASETSSEATSEVAIPPLETIERVAAIDPELFWENWFAPGNIETSGRGAIERPELPDPNAPRRRGSAFAELRAVVVWNGESGDAGRELLVVESTQKPFAPILKGERDLLLGALPLPGAPLGAKRVGSEFAALKKALTAKYSRLRPQDPSFDEPPILPARTIYRAFAIEAENLATFKSRVDARVDAIWSGSEIVLSKDDELVLNEYFKRCYRYFFVDAFDFVLGDDEGFEKAPIAVTFQTPTLFVPMEIARMGGGETSGFELIVLSPDKSGLVPKESPKGVAASVFPAPSRDPAIDFSLDELKRLAPSVGDFCEECGIDETFARVAVGIFDVEEVSGDLKMVVRGSENQADASKDESDPEIENASEQSDVDDDETNDSSEPSETSDSDESEPSDREGEQ